MSGTTGSLRIIGRGLGVLPATVNLQPTASGTWTDTGLQVALPDPGTYRLDATVRTALTGSSPVNTYIVARLIDTASGDVVPYSEVLVQQINIGASSGVVNSGNNNTAPVQVEHTVPGPRAVRLEAARFDGTGASTSARVMSDHLGRTTLRWLRVA